MSDQAPDVLGHFDGWKGLLADTGGGLWSPSVHTFWPPGEWLQAKCTRGHTPPVKNCGCGIYAVKTYEDLRNHSYHWGEASSGLSLGSLDLTDELAPKDTIWVLAEIALKGDVSRGKIGWRAEKGCVTTVYVPATKIALGSRIRNRYGCGLGVVDRFSGKREILSQPRRRT